MALRGTGTTSRRLESAGILFLLVAFPCVRAIGDEEGFGDEEVTRVEEWTKLREEREGRREPYHAGWLERTLLGIEKA
ncbi:MAG TPA: hypothetical protein VIC87_03555, partial [Vicinamibacteria bacterium]